MLSSNPLHENSVGYNKYSPRFKRRMNNETTIHNKRPVLEALLPKLIESSKRLQTRITRGITPTPHLDSKFTELTRMNLTESQPSKAQLVALAYGDNN